MLVLSRKAEESILLTIGDITIRVIVFEASQGKVRLGIEAPKEVSICRDDAVIKEKK